MIGIVAPRWAVAEVVPSSSQTAPAALLDIATGREVLKLDSTGTDGNIDIQAGISAVAVFLEDRTNQKIRRRQFDIVYDGEPCAPWLRIPVHALYTVDAVTTYGSDDVAAVLSTSAYQVDTISQPGRLALRSGYSWPSGLRAMAGLVIRVTAGPATPPDWSVNAAKQLLAYFREHIGEAGPMELPAEVTAQIDLNRWPEA